jgi:hypothetical protein
MQQQQLAVWAVPGPGSSMLNCLGCQCMQWRCSQTLIGSSMFCSTGSSSSGKQWQQQALDQAGRGPCSSSSKQVQPHCRGSNLWGRSDHGSKQQQQGQQQLQQQLPSNGSSSSGSG